MHFGVGRALYALDAPWLREGPGDGELRRNSKGNLILDERTASWLREQYGRWLERRGRAQFGEPLDHSREPETSGPETRSGKPMAEVSALRRRKAA